MSQYKLKDISHIINAKKSVSDDRHISYILTDSRRLTVPGKTLFFAIRGERHDGHDYIKQLYDKGVRSFVIDKKPENFSDINEKAVFLYVENSLEALQQLAAFHREAFTSPVIAVTGSNGKTIVKEWLFQVLSDEYKVIRSPRSYNSQVGVPLSLWLLDDFYQKAIIEAGISKPGEMKCLEKMIKPDIGIITNIGQAHQENFRDLKHKTEEKISLFQDVNVILYSSDYEVVDEMLKNKYPDKKLVSWSKNKKADLMITDISYKEKEAVLYLLVLNQKKKIKIPFTDKVSVENALHIINYLFFEGYNEAQIQRLVNNLEPVSMRMEMKKGEHKCTLINDTYNSDLNSLSLALDFLIQQNQHKKKTLILSDILQSGLSDNQLYHEVNKLLIEKKIGRLIGVGEKISSFRDIFGLESDFYKSTNDLLRNERALSFYDEAILLKGARNFHFEKISRLLEEKSHRTRLEVNMNAMIHNLNYFRSFLAKDTKMLVMVKAFSYGSGTYEIANMLQFQKVDYLGVAFADEGVQLREAGISLPVIVMNPTENSYDLMIEHELEPEIYDMDGLKQFESQMNKSGVDQYPVHLKLNTGMNRLGFSEGQLDQLITMLKNSRVVVKSVFSHLAAADEPGHDAFTQNQIKRFDEASENIVNALGYDVIRHILNSAGIERFPESQFDMVRLGIGLYGISAVDKKNVEVVSSLKSYLAQIREVTPNETVGYGRKAEIKHDTTIGVVPVGYADGLNRWLSNGKGSLIVNGKKVPVVGNICMDMCMVDVTGMDVQKGDEVEVFGSVQTISDIANDLNTIPYEVLTNVSPRVKRIYFQE